VRHARALAAVVVLAAGAPAFAQEGVLLEVRGKDKVLGTIRPANESEAVFGTLVKGTVLKAAAKSKDKNGPIPSLAVLANDVPVDVQIVAKGRAVAIEPYTVPATAVYKVVVTGDGEKDGDYQLSVAWTPQKFFSGTAVSAHSDSFPFSAPADATASILLVPGKGSGFVPNLENLLGPSTMIPLSGGGKAREELPQRGDWNVLFSTAGTDGPYSIRVVVTAPKPKSHTTDIRDSTLSGAFGGGTLAIGAVIDDEGGSVGGDGFDGTPLEGSSVKIPPDSLGDATTIYVAQSEPYTPPGGDAPAGPAVEFGPPGTEFEEGKPAVVTIPFDPDAFPGGVESLIVYVKDQNGDVVPVPGPYSFGPDTVTFTTSHFSVFQAATNADRGFPAGFFPVLGIGGRPLMGDSGEVLVTIGFLQMSAPSDYAMFFSETGVQFAPGSLAPTPDASPVVHSRQASGRVVAVDDSAFDLLDPVGNKLATLRRGVRDDVLLLEHVEKLSLTSLTAFRRPDGGATLNSIAGKWHLLVWEFRGEPVTGTPTTRPFACVADAGSATFSTAGEVEFDFGSRVVRTTQFPGGDWNSATTKGPRVTFPVSIDDDRQLVVTMDGGSGMVLEPVLGGDAMFGTVNGLDRGGGLGRAAANIAVFFLVRASKDARVADLAGVCADDAGGLQLHLPTGTPSADVTGLFWRADSGRTSFGADRTFTQTLLSCTSGYPGGVIDPVSDSVLVNEPAGARWSLAGDGKLTMAPLGAIGAALPGGEVGVYLRRGGEVMTLGLLSRLRTAGGTKR
jgi:hypothetical protein